MPQSKVSSDGMLHASVESFLRRNATCADPENFVIGGPNKFDNVFLMMAGEMI